MTIRRCALGIITQRGREVVSPTLSTLSASEQSFLQRHVEELQRQTRVEDARARFAPNSTLSQVLEAIRDSDDDAFVSAASAMVDALAEAMKRVPAKPACVVAVVEEHDFGYSRVSLLKLDAEIEAAQLERTAGGIRLHVFEDLLPRPGEIQKGFSWPDARPGSDLMVLDRQRAGSAAKYFQAAFGIEVSPPPRETEDALAAGILQLPRQSIADAVSAIGDGGPAETVVARIQAAVPEANFDATQLGHSDSLAGYIRSSFGATGAVRYRAGAVEINVPLTELSSVEFRQEGDLYVAVIRSSVPFTSERFHDGRRA